MPAFVRRPYADADVHLESPAPPPALLNLVDVLDVLEDVHSVCIDLELRLRFRVQERLRAYGEAESVASHEVEYVRNALDVAGHRLGDLASRL